MYEGNYKIGNYGWTDYLGFITDINTHAREQFKQSTNQ